MCQRPEICVPINHCSSINQKLFDRSLSDIEINNLKSIQCGFVKNVVYVCCNSSLPSVGTCGKIKIDLKVVGGSQAPLGQYPWLALIGRRWRNNDGSTGIEYECGGTIISDRYILTAAHCVKFEDNDFKEKLRSIEKVKLGEWDTSRDPDYDELQNRTSDPVVILDVEKIIPHKNHRLYHRLNDIALLRLKEKIPKYTAYIEPICIPDEDEEYSKLLTVIGWGKSENNSLKSIQRYGTVNLVTHERCNKEYKNKIKSTQLCAGSVGIDSCNGDSGGPLVDTNSRKNFIAGIVSHGPRECGTIGTPGIYTDVRKYVDWIEQNVIH